MPSLPPRGAKGGPPPVPPAVFEQGAFQDAAFSLDGSAAAPGGSAVSSPRKKAGRIPFFSVKQVLLFAALALCVIVLDLTIYVGLGIYETGILDSNGSPRSMVVTLADELYAEEVLSETSDGFAGDDADRGSASESGSASPGGSAYETEPPSSPVEGAIEAGVSYDGRSYFVSPELIGMLDEAKAWAMFIGEDGEVVWSYALPEDVPLSYDITSAALVGHYRMVNDYPVKIWSRTDGIAVVGTPRDSYITGGYSLEYGTFMRVPFYAMLVFLVDIAIFFAVYVVSKRRVAKGAAPAMQALADISEGRPVDVHLKGALSGIGESLNSASRIIQAKDTARRNWVSGVSHDIRTPLSMIMGYAEQISRAAGDDGQMRQQADVIMRQSMRIRDLVEDLNIASKLEYDMQPLNRERLLPARLAREVVVMTLNGGLDERFDIDLDVGEDAESMLVEGDARLIKRALSNAINNAVLHNEDGCSVLVRVSKDPAGFARILVADDGRGVDEATLIRLAGVMAGSAGTGVGSYASAALSDAPVLPQTSDGHGLGLALIARIAVVHGGSATVGWAIPPAEPGQPGRGFAVEVKLLLAAASDDGRPDVSAVDADGDSCCP